MDRAAKLAHLLQTSERLAIAAERDLGARVEHCPEWTVLDLVAHIAGVQWFWASIVEGKMQEPEDMQRPDGIPAHSDPIEWFRTQTIRLHDALSNAADADRVWTWWPEDQSVGFVLTRQLNESVVHCFDACNATGTATAIDPDVAVLGLQEFRRRDVARPCGEREDSITVTSGGDRPTATGAPLCSRPERVSP